MQYIHRAAWHTRGTRARHTQRQSSTHATPTTYRVSSYREAPAPHRTPHTARGPRPHCDTAQSRSGESCGRVMRKRPTAHPYLYTRTSDENWQWRQSTARPSALSWATRWAWSRAGAHRALPHRGEARSSRDPRLNVRQRPLSAAAIVTTPRTGESRRCRLEPARPQRSAPVRLSRRLRGE